jgi:hypothetical protein
VGPWSDRISVLIIRDYIISYNKRDQRGLSPPCADRRRCFFESQEETPHQNPAMLWPSSWTSRLQNREKINFCSLICPGYAICYSGLTQRIHDNVFGADFREGAEVEARWMLPTYVRPIRAPQAYVRSREHDSRMFSSSMSSKRVR